VVVIGLHGPARASVRPLGSMDSLAHEKGRAARWRERSRRRRRRGARNSGSSNKTMAQHGTARPLGSMDSQRTKKSGRQGGGQEEEEEEDGARGIVVVAIRLWPSTGLCPTFRLNGFASARKKAGGKVEDKKKKKKKTGREG